jgi:carbon monoxide dehydrogenase subunit G
MEMTGEHAVPAPADHVWKALTDPETLKSCIPGCDSIEADGENGYRMQMAARVGPVSARFSGKMRMADIDVERGYTLRFEGSGGAAGFVNGEAHVTLTPGPDGTTTLTYVAKAQVGGKLAQVGSRLIDGAAHKMTDEFFSHFVAACAAPATSIVAEPGRKRHWTVYAAMAVTLIGLLYLVIRR